MAIKEKNLQQEHEELDAIVKAILHTTEVDEIYLFGSHAQGTSTPESDFDIYVVIPDNSIRPLIAMQKLGLAISSLQKRPVDLLVGKKSEFLKRKEIVSFIEHEVSNYGVKLYA